jgi:hypothetical protein
MHAKMRIAPWPVGYASGPISKSGCRSRVAHRRVVSVGAGRGAGTIASGSAAAGADHMPDSAADRHRSVV